MKTCLTWIFSTQAPKTTLFIRIMVGAVFLSEGIQKFLYPAELAAGRFIKIGIPFPELMGPFVGAVEIIGGICLLAGVMTRFAAFTLLINMGVAVLSTKIPILLGHDLWLFNAPELPRYGFWSMAHAARTDFSMIMGSLFLLFGGAGPWSLDPLIAKRLSTPAAPPTKNQDAPRQ